MEQRESKWTAQGSSWTNPGWCEMEATCWFKHCYGQYLHQKPHKITGVSQNQYFKWTQLWVGWFRSKIWVTVTYERGDWVWRRNVSILIIANLYYKANMEILKKFSPQGQKVIIFCAPKCLKKKVGSTLRKTITRSIPAQILEECSSEATDCFLDFLLCYLRQFCLLSCSFPLLFFVYTFCV